MKKDFITLNFSDKITVHLTANERGAIKMNAAYEKIKNYNRRIVSGNMQFVLNSPTIKDEGGLSEFIIKSEIKYLNKSNSSMISVVILSEK